MPEIRSWDITKARKNTYHVLDFYVQDWRWMGSILNSYLCDLVSLYWFLSVDIFLIQDLLWDEMVNLWIFTIGLTSAGCQPHTSCIWPWSGVPKVRLYDTFLGGLRQDPFTMVNSSYSNHQDYLFISPSLLKDDRIGRMAWGEQAAEDETRARVEKYSNLQE